MKQINRIARTVTIEFGTEKQAKKFSKKLRKKVEKQEQRKEGCREMRKLWVRACYGEIKEDNNDIKKS